MTLSLAIAAVSVAACSGNAESAAHHNFVLVGSTPCDVAIRAALDIPAETKCDFIRWSVAMDPAKGNAYKLDANYGEAQPNTLGFVAGGHTITAAGKFSLNATGRNAARQTYRLTSDKHPVDVSLVKVNPNLFHLLMPDGTMMVGNGGWSYTLYRKPALPSTRLTTAVFAEDADLPKPARAVFEGRTPCREIAELAGITPGVADCLKIKWRITFDRDAATLEPTIFTVESTINRRETARGTWTESRSNDAIVYRLTPAPPLKPISLLVAGRDVLYFLGPHDALLTGNENFGYTLNRRLTPVRSGE